MSSYDPDKAEDDAPLDPVQERLRRKLARLLLVSSGIMMLGFIAVFAAIVYRMSERDGTARGLSAAEPVEAQVAIPAGQRVVAVALDGDRALLTLAGPDGATSLLLVDLASGGVLGRYAVAAE
jgi:hypothetical protein